MDCSTIGNSKMYIDRTIRNLNLSETARYRRPHTQRDATKIDFLNFIPHMIRNYRIPILYFVDSFWHLKKILCGRPAEQIFMTLSLTDTQILNYCAIFSQILGKLISLKTK